VKTQANLKTQVYKPIFIEICRETCSKDGMMAMTAKLEEKMDWNGNHKVDHGNSVILSLLFSTQNQLEKGINTSSALSLSQDRIIRAGKNINVFS